MKTSFTFQAISATIALTSTGKTMTHKPKRVLGIFSITMITIAGIFNPRTLPLMAKYGFSSVFFYCAAAILFFIPSALTAAELAAGWPKKGGIYAWVSEAFGSDVGFVTVWLEWINTVVAFPTTLALIAATIAYVFAPALAHNKIYMVCTMLSLFWGITLINFLGIEISSWVSSLGLIFGTLLPTILIITLGAAWWVSGHPLQMTLSWHQFVPTFHLHSAVLLLGVILGLAGIQVAAFHIHETKHPKRDFPKAILISTLIILLVSILGSLAIAMVIPANHISLVTGILQTAQLFFGHYHLNWLVSIMAFLMVLGAGAMLNTWLIAPAKGLQASVKDEHLPKLLRYCNEKGVPVAVLLLQAIISTILSLIFLYMPSISSSYWLLTALSAMITCMMYLPVFASVIRLRYTQPDTLRPYKIPGGKKVVWLVAGTGFIVCLLSIFLGFFAPTQLDTGNAHFYHAFILGGILIFCVPPFFFRFQSRRRQKSNN
jgi:glutamate:GABA antiporter